MIQKYIQIVLKFYTIFADNRDSCEKANLSKEWDAKLPAW